MRRFFPILVLLTLSCGSLSAEEAWLRWNNGDELKGIILESVEGKIRWKAEPFSKPFELSLDHLESIRFSSSNRKPDASEKGEPEFRIVMLNGDRLDGQLMEIGSETVTLSCAPFTAPVEIRRDAIERIVHINSEALRYSGPGDLEGWTSTGRDRKTTDWFTDLKGAFATHQWSGNLFRKIEFPSSVEIRFSAEFPLGHPNLEIGLIQNAEEGPRIETWDKFLVLTYRTRFAPVMELTKETKSLDFRLFWNQDNGDLRLCDPSGKLLASLDGALVDRVSSAGDSASRAKALARGFSIHNHNPELKLHSLTVQEWDGKPVQVIDLSKPRVQLAGSPPRFGISDIRLASGSDSIQIGGRNHSLEKIQEIILSPNATAGETADSVTRIAWFGGTTVSGDFRSVNAESVSVLPPWSENPVTIGLHDAREIHFPPAKLAKAGSSDHLEGEGLSLHGAIRPLPGAVEENLIGWQPPGADAAVPFADKFKAKVTRTPFSASKPAGSSMIGEGRVYLENDEILVGTLISVTREHVHFTSRVTGQLELPVEMVRAVDIGGAGRVLEGFGDSEWEESEEDDEDVVLTKDKAIIQAGSFGNPSLLLGNRIFFSAEWDQSYGAITLRLFADSPDETTASTDVIIAAQGNRLFVGKLKESGAFSFSGDQIPIVGNKAKFEISTEPDKVQVLVNGKSTLTIPVDPENVSGNGLYFKMGGGWQGWNQNDNEITLTDFRIERAPGSIPRRIIDPKAKANALTVPRSLREKPPTHLLIAPNGDLLRGTLQAASGDSIRFSSGDQTFELPRHRVSAIVWLKPADEKQPEEDAEEAPKEEPRSFDEFPVTHQFTLMDGSRLRLRSERIDNNRFVGRSAILGECSVSISNIREMRRGPATAARDLEQSRLSAFADWKLELTPDPNIPGAGGEADSPLIGTPAPPIELTMLGEEEKFSLKTHKGRVVVLDFWATWCGPCIKAMPDVQEAVGAFPPGAVIFRAINQAETAPIVSDFLEARGWQETPVAFDHNMAVSKAYQVEGIPHTVVIAKDGTIAWSHSGYSDQLKEKLFEAIAGELQK
jgi:thiol-disulfide isomerase/thioredoxin